MILACSLSGKDLLEEKLVHRLEDSPLGIALLDILVEENLSTVFQPIVSLKKQQTYAFEALTRGPESTPFNNPLNLFNAAIEHGCLREVDLLARKVALQTFKKYDTEQLKDCFLFLNVSVQTFMNMEKAPNGDTIKCLQELGLSADRVVIEITELLPVDDYELFVSSVMHYRNMGFKVAIDDLGGGYNGLRLWSEVSPDYVKIDKHFVTDVHLKKEKQRFIETIVTLAKSLNTKVIAEGVEVKEELSFLKRAGVEFVQGFLFSKPNPVPNIQLDFDCLPDYDAKKQVYDSEETVALLLQPYQVVLPHVTVADCSRIMLDDENIDYLPVVKEGGKVRGIVWRRELMDKLARPYGQSLHHRKRVKDIMDRDPIVVDINTPLVELSRLVTDSLNDRVGNAFIIVENSKYVGVGTFNQLLKVMTDLRVESAQFSNPLSGLPGNNAIQKVLQQKITVNERFSVCYIDVDHFKPYNDHYSFEEGDQIIKLIADILAEVALHEEDFIGHVGGDDFMFITNNVDKAIPIIELILQKFQSMIPMFYSEEDRMQKGIFALDRHGQQQFFQMMSLSIGVLKVEPDSFHHTQELASFATKAKKGAKKLGGNTYFIVETEGLQHKEVMNN